MTKDELQALLDTYELHAFLGLELLEVGDGSVSYRFAPPPAARGADGSVHGGALATALDTAATTAVISRAGHDVSTVDLRIDYVRPALDAEFRVEGVTVRAGRRLGTADATVSTAEGKTIALARGTFVL